MNALTAGTASVDLTPGWPVMMGGFGQRTTPCTGVKDPVHAKALHLRDAHEQVLVITADLIAMPAPVADAVVEQLVASTGLQAAQICLSASHSHSAPLPYDPSPQAVGVARFTVFLIDALVDVGQRAIASARPAVLRTGVGHVGFLNNRCQRASSQHVDDRVAVVVLDDAGTGAPFGVLFGVGCHPVTLGWDNMEISADYPGVARRLIEERLGVVDALFVNGTEGDVIPTTSPDRDSLDPRGYCGGTYADTVAIGTALADEVVRAVGQATPFTGEMALAARLVRLTIAGNNARLDATAAEERLDHSAAVLRSFLGDDVLERVPPQRMWAAASEHVIAHDLTEADMQQLMIATCYHLGLLARKARGGTTPALDVPVQVLRIGEFAFLAVPGEPVVDVGLEWQQRVGELTGFVIGLANGYLRYLPRQADFEAAGSDVRYETVTVGLAPEGVEIVLDGASELLASMA